MKRALSLLVAAVSVAGCGEERTDGPTASLAPISITEALALEREGEVAVRGVLLIDGAGERLCSGFAESYPPQCAEPSLALRGLPPWRSASLRREGSVRWSEEPMELVGTLDGRTFTVHETAE